MPRKERGGGGAADGGKGAKNPLADMFNLQMPDDDEEGLMAELAALQGIKPPSKGFLSFSCYIKLLLWVLITPNDFEVGAVVFQKENVVFFFCLELFVV